MPKLSTHSDPQVNNEFDNIYNKLDMYQVSSTEPKSPRAGTIWFNPDTGALKIWKLKDWQTI